MSTYDDDQSEDGELARSPIQDEMDFSLSDDDQDHSLVIKPPQAIIRSSHRERRAHKRSGKDRHKDVLRKEKKHLYRDRDKPEKPKISKNVEHDDTSKEFYREKQYYRDVYREKDGREKEVYREKDVREKEMYREKEIREKDLYRDKELNRERELYKESYREREHYRERDVYREGATYREGTAYREGNRSREVYREKELYKDKDPRDRDTYSNKERQGRYFDIDRKQRQEADRIESRLRLLADDGHSMPQNEKENRDKTSGDKELEDLRSRLLSKRISKELQSQDSKKHSDYEKNSKSDRHSSLDKVQQERRKKLLEAEREMEKRKNQSRNELEARREERRRRGKKRSVSPDDDMANKRNKSDSSPTYEQTFIVSDASDVEMKSNSPHSEPEEGEHSKTDTEEESSSTDTESDVSASRSEDEDHNDDEKFDDEKDVEPKEKSLSPSPKSEHCDPSLKQSPKSNSRSKSRSRSRSHSFSPPPPEENGKSATEDEKVINEEESKLIEEKIKLLPPYFPALQGCRSVEEFHCLNRIEEGTYGVVYRARDRTTEEIVALKRLKMEKEKEGFPITSLREINTLLKARHLLPARGLC